MKVDDDTLIISVFFLLDFIFFLKIYFRERAWGRAGSRTEGEGGHLKQTEYGAIMGLNLTTLRWWSEPKSRAGRLADWPTQAPHLMSFYHDIQTWVWEPVLEAALKSWTVWWGILPSMSHFLSVNTLFPPSESLKGFALNLDTRILKWLNRTPAWFSRLVRWHSPPCFHHLCHHMHFCSICREPGAPHQRPPWFLWLECSLPAAAPSFLWQINAHTHPFKAHLPGSLLGLPNTVTFPLGPFGLHLVRCNKKLCWLMAWTSQKERFRGWLLLLFIDHHTDPIRRQGIFLSWALLKCLGFHVHISSLMVLRWLLKAGASVSEFKAGRRWKEWCQSWLLFAECVTTCWPVEW